MINITPGIASDFIALGDSDIKIIDTLKPQTYTQGRHLMYIPDDEIKRETG